MMAAMLIEVVNVVSVITNFEIISVVQKGMTLIVLMTFSNIFYSAYDEVEYKKVITDKKYKDFFKIQTSTSLQAYGDWNKIEPQTCEKRIGNPN